MKTADSVKVTTFIEVDPEDAFDVFTRETDLWWRRGPRYRTGGDRRGTLRFEPGAGGRLVEAFDDGEVFEIGRVLVWGRRHARHARASRLGRAARRPPCAPRSHRRRLHCHDRPVVGRARHGAAHARREAPRDAISSAPMKTRQAFVGLTIAVTGVACHSSSSPSSPTAPVDSGPPGSCAVTAPTLADWRIHADGTLFRDASDRVVFLRGVNAGGRSKFAPYVPFDYPAGGYATALSAYMDRAKSWGIDVMRVPFTWAALEPVEGQTDDAWLAMYDQFLDAAWAHGIYTIVDFHQDVYSEVFCGDGFPAWTVPDAGPLHHDCPQWQLEYYQDPGVTAAFDVFWDASSPVQVAYGKAWDGMVARYKDKPGVLGFEPINEPGWGTADEKTFDATTLTAFYSTMVARMRTAAPSSLVFVDPTGIDGTLVSTTLAKPTPVTGTGGADGIVFAPHYYPLGNDTMDPNAGLQTWTKIGAAWNVPTFLGEFGASHDDVNALPYMTDIFTAIDALGLSATEWEYSVESEEWNSETDSLVGSDGGEYEVVQAVARPFARAVGGSAITQAWDPTAQTFTLAYTPASGVTEVSLPSRAFPSGYAVTITGACFDASTPGRILVQPDASSKSVSLKITPRETRD